MAIDNTIANLLAGILASPTPNASNTPVTLIPDAFRAAKAERQRLHDTGHCDPAECEIIDSHAIARIEAAEKRAHETEAADKLARIAHLESEIARVNAETAALERRTAYIVEHGRTPEEAEREARERIAPRTAMVPIPGNSYPVKDALRGMGGRWDGQAKIWSVPADRADEARALVASVANVKVPFRNGGARKGRGGRSGGFRRAWKPCGYPGCNRSHCDECDGKGG